MATCNGSLYVRAQLESILAQLGPDDELVISDDSSKDDTLAIVKSYPDPRINLLTGNEFHSPIRNFEHALRNARGLIVVLSDQDDIWLPSRLDLVREKLWSKRDRVSLIMMDGELIDSEGHSMGKSVFTNFRAGSGLLKNIYDNTYTGCCLAFTRPLLDIVLPFPVRIPMHDMWLGILAEIYGRVEFVPIKTLLYRRHGNNTSYRSSNVHEQILRRVFLSLSLLQRCIGISIFKRYRV
jgi:glycosyltransferase involved in cell wall biosynthesis